MNNDYYDFTIAELDAIHMALITRERVIREDLIPICADKVESLTVEADDIRRLSLKVCSIKFDRGYMTDMETVPS